MTHYSVNVSGGFGSFAALLSIATTQESFSASFAETNIEHPDLYRFLVETIKGIAGQPVGAFLSNLIDSVPPLNEIELRKKHLKLLGNQLAFEVPWFHYISSDDTPFDIFVKRKFAGGMKGDPCSLELKREPLDAYNRKLHEQYGNLKVVVGIGDEEKHRMIAMYAKENLPWTWCAPLIDSPDSVSKAYEFLGKYSIALPELYNLGFAHNNCGGFCIKSGQQQATLLYRKLPNDYLWFESQEERLREVLPKYRHQYIGHIRKVTKGISRWYTLREWRTEVLEKQDNPDIENDSMGCACFTTVD